LRLVGYLKRNVFLIGLLESLGFHDTLMKASGFIVFCLLFLTYCYSNINYDKGK